MLCFNVFASLHLDPRGGRVSLLSPFGFAGSVGQYPGLQIKDVDSN